MIEHRTPSTYILRELNDVEVLPPVAWYPETIGWKIVAALLALLCAYWGYRSFKRWWQNRYRREAINAINTSLSLSSSSREELAYRLFSVLKSVLYYLDSQHGRLQNDAFLRTLDAMDGSSKRAKRNPKNTRGDFQFCSELGKRWMLSLVNPSERLSAADLEQLSQQSLRWLTQHQVVGGQANV